MTNSEIYSMLQSGEKLPIKFDLDLLNTMLIYAFDTETSIIKKSHLVNMQMLFEVMDPKSYEQNADMLYRYNTIKNALEARINKQFRNKKMIINYCNDKKSNKSINKEKLLRILDSFILTGEEIEWINKLVSDKLTYAHLYIFKDKIYDHFNQLEEGFYDTEEDINEKLKGTLVNLLSSIRRVESNREHDMVFDLTDGFESTVSEIVDKLTSPSNRLKVGLKGLNEITKGGFECGRFFMFLGLSGNFKSGLLLSVAKWIRLYNKEFKPKDPTKRPTVLMVTMENTIVETVERLFNMVGGTTDIIDYEKGEVIDILKNKGHFDVNDEYNINIRIVYKPNKSINTNDLYTIIEHIEDDGYEVIALVLDYIKRIRSVHNYSELRLELGAVVDELKVLAQRLDIPVISASQINRSGALKVDEAKGSGRYDVAKDLGRGHVGESWNMIENADLTCIINIELGPDGQYYLAFNLVKRRFGGSDLKYFNQPFADGDSIKLLEDELMTEPIFKLSLSSLMEDDVKSLDKRGRTNAKERKKLKDFKTIDKKVAGF